MNAPLAWKPTPNSRRLLLVVREGDPKPADPFIGEWWSGWHAVIEWIGAGEWEWTVWAPQRHGTGPAAESGAAATAKGARRRAAECLLRLMTDATASERAQLEALASSSALSAPADRAE